MDIKKYVDINVLITTCLVSFTCTAFVYAIFDYIAGKLWVSFMMVLAGILGAGLLYWFVSKRKARRIITHVHEDEAV